MAKQACDFHRVLNSIGERLTTACHWYICDRGRIQDLKLGVAQMENRGGCGVGGCGGVVIFLFQIYSFYTG